MTLPEVLTNGGVRKMNHGIRDIILNYLETYHSSFGVSAHFLIISMSDNNTE